MTKINILKNRSLLTILLSLIIFIIFYLISISNVLYNFNKEYQRFYYWLSNDLYSSKNIVVVEIDEDTLSWRRDANNKISLEWLWQFPFDRKYYWKVIDNLLNDWANIIALDIIFWEKSWDWISDDILSESIKKAWNVILWSWTDSDWTLRHSYEKFSKHIYNEWYFLSVLDNYILYWFKPFYWFKSSNKLEDHFIIAIIKWYYSKIYNDTNLLDIKPELYKDKVKYWDKIELILPYKYTDKELEIAKKMSNWELINQEENKYNYDILSIRNKENILINFLPASEFNRLSFLDVYYWKYHKSLIEDKIVLIWFAVSWKKDDLFNTPIWSQFWVFTHANAINTILTNNFIKYLDLKIEYLLVFLLIIVSVYFNISKSSKVLIFSNISIISIFILFILFSLIYSEYLLNYPTEIGFSFFISLVVSNILKYYIENRNKTKLNKALSEYVAEDVANEILSWDWKVNLNWENKIISIFFSDIEWFTSISEKFSPEELVSFLRDYISEMSNIIMDQWWFINKYEWDAIMALWWVFSSNWDETYKICFSAIEQQKTLKNLNIKWQNKLWLNIKVRMWIHIWNAIIWNIWAKWRKMEFTALWDNVNIASRLESVNKYYWTYLCVSEYIYEKEKENFEFRYLDNIKVKWKDKPLKIYELLCLKWNLSQEEIELFSKYKIAINIYNEMKFTEALKIFEELVNLWDKPSKTYIERCEFYIKNSPWKDWNWVWTMTSK